MRITLVNITKSPIIYHAGDSGSLETDNKNEYPLQIALLPSSSTTTDLPRRCSKLTLIPKVELKHDVISSPIQPTDSTNKRASEPRFSIQVKSLKQSRLLAEIDGGEQCPWRICRTKQSSSHYKLVILPFRNLSSFLSPIPDTVPISSLLLPGTHETMAFYGWPFSQCQKPPDKGAPDALLAQLHSGIRALDIRLSIIDGALVTFHGPYPQRTAFTTILETLYQFLSKEGSRECIIVSIKQEDKASSDFTKLVHSEIDSSPGGPGLWFTESNHIPTLGEVRGRCVLFSRFGDPSTGDLGIHPNIWPDSKKEGFEWTCGGTVVRVSDWYGIVSFLSIPEKVQLSTSILLPPSEITAISPPGQANAAGAPSLSIAFFSASSIPLALPPVIARGFGWPRWGFGVVGVNERVGIWLLNELMQSDTTQQELEETSRPRLVSRFFRFSHDSTKGKATATSDTSSVHAVGDEGEGPRIRGWAFIDFYEDPVESDVVSLLVECNFRGRKVGEEGWL